MRTDSAAAVAFALALAVVVGTDVSAHRRDEYLQAARLAIAPGRVEVQLDLTPGISVAEAIITDIDRNRDGVPSPDEQRAYVASVLGAIALDIDGHPLQMRPVASRFPDLEALRRGEGSIELQATADLPKLSDGAHQLAYRNIHRRDIGVYLANALVPDSDRVAITAQQRDAGQRDLTIQYVLRDGPGTSLARAWLLGCVTAAAVWALLMLRSTHATSRHTSRSPLAD